MDFPFTYLNIKLRHDAMFVGKLLVYLCHCHYPTHLQTPKMCEPHLVG